MNLYDFQKVRNAVDIESATHAIFAEAHSRWTDEGGQNLTEGQITVLTVETYFGEVLNGGFYQYFSNEFGGFANQAPAALRRVGLHAYAIVLEQFLALFPDGRVPQDADIRQEQLDNIGEEHDEELIEQLEEPFWDLYRKDEKEFRQKLFDYIIANEREFTYDSE